MLHRFRFLSSPLSRHENRHAAADPYYRPGDKELAEAVRAVAHKHHAVLLANHGPVVAGSSLSAAGAAAEELKGNRQAPPFAARSPDALSHARADYGIARGTSFLIFRSRTESTSLAWSASGRRFRDPWLRMSPPRARILLMSGRGTQGEGFGGVSSGIGEPFVFVAACFSRANMSLSVESTRVESLVKIL